MCKKVINEDLEHIFIKCDIAKKCFQYVKENFLEDKETSNSLVLLKFKRRSLFHIYSRQETNMFGPESPHMSNSVVYLK